MGIVNDATIRAQRGGILFRKRHRGGFRGRPHHDMIESQMPKQTEHPRRVLTTPGANRKRMLHDPTAMKIESTALKACFRGLGGRCYLGRSSA